MIVTPVDTKTTSCKSTAWQKHAEAAFMKLYPDDIRVVKGNSLQLPKNTVFIPVAPKVACELEYDVIEEAIRKIELAHFVWFPNIKDTLYKKISSSDLGLATRTLQIMTTLNIGENIINNSLPLLDPMEEGSILSPQVDVASRTDNVRPHMDNPKNTLLSIGYSPSPPNKGLEAHGNLNIWNTGGCQTQSQKGFYHGHLISGEYLKDVECFTPPDQNSEQYPFFVLVDGGNGEKVVAHSVTGTKTFGEDCKRYVHRVNLKRVSGASYIKLYNI